MLTPSSSASIEFESQPLVAEEILLGVDLLRLDVVQTQNLDDHLLQLSL